MAGETAGLSDLRHVAHAQSSLQGVLQDAQLAVQPRCAKRADRARVRVQSRAAGQCARASLLTWAM